ncbi:MAG: zinc metallopeptidase, partial [Clostridiales bacterium]|nr:zinc metallopeptidase [Clostridiales bacterium]
MGFTDLFTDPAYLLYGITMCLFIPFLLFSVIALIRVNTVFNKYNNIQSSSGISAQGYVRNFLTEEGLTNIKFAAVRGSLTDNFNPTNNTISLSDTVRGSSAIGAIGVACHEAGHAVQHARKYFFSSARLKLVPVVNIASSLMWPIFIIGYILGFASPYTSIGRMLLTAGLVVMGLTLLFSLVTLPTEFDASRRAYKYLKTCMLPQEAAGVKKVLRAAAMTYVASFMVTALQFLRILALLLMGR